MDITEETAFVVLFILASACAPFMVKPMTKLSECCFDWAHNSKVVGPGDVSNTPGYEPFLADTRI